MGATQLTTQPQPAAPGPDGLLRAVAWTALGYTIAVILWGAVVRVTGAGAGCGEHWPLCNGVALPVNPTLNTVIEFSHRLTSGVSGLLAIALLALALLRAPRGHPVRFGAWLSLALIVLEGLVGGVQVLLGLTAQSTDPARGLVQGVHLANTFLLTGALLLTALWASGAPRLRLRGQGWLGWGVALGVIAMLGLGMAGAVTALGDLLFRPEAGTPIDTVRRDFGSASGLIERLRVLHPAMAVFVSAYLVWFAGRAQALRPLADLNRWRLALYAVIGLQMLAGVLNIILKAPNALQLIHLLLACLMWLVTVRLGFGVLSSAPEGASVPARPAALQETMQERGA